MTKTMLVRESRGGFGDQVPLRASMSGDVLEITDEDGKSSQLSGVVRDWVMAHLTILDEAEVPPPPATVTAQAPAVPTPDLPPLASPAPAHLAPPSASVADLPSPDPGESATDYAARVLAPKGVTLQQAIDDGSLARMLELTAPGTLHESWEPYMPKKAPTQ